MKNSLTTSVHSWFRCYVTLGLTQSRVRKSRSQSDPHPSVTPRVLSVAGGIPGHELRRSL